jgi:predicted DNA-binding protein
MHPLLLYNRCMSTKEKDIKSLSIRFPVHILEQMKEIAKRHNRSLSGEVLTALEEHIKRNQKGK